MLKRIILVGLGITIIAARKSLSLLNERRSAQTAQASEAGSIESSPEPATGDMATEEASDRKVVDDLTKIKGVGPTYAARLEQAGIYSFTELQHKTAEELREITQAKGQSVDPDSWIEQASLLAGSN